MRGIHAHGRSFPNAWPGERLFRSSFPLYRRRRGRLSSQSETPAPMKTLIAISMVFTATLLADDFKTTTGEEYKSATVSRVEPDGIVVTFSGGIIKIPFTE